MVRRGGPGSSPPSALLVTLLCAFALTKPWLLAGIVAQPLALRIALSVAVIAPMGVCMGLPMSMGMTVLRVDRPMVWGWALNGVCSVFGSVLAMYLATNVEIATAIVFGTGCYAIAGTLLLVIYRHQTAVPVPAQDALPAAETYSMQHG